MVGSSWLSLRLEPEEGVMKLEKSLAVMVLTLLAAGGIFAIDINTLPGMGEFVLYLLPMLLTAWVKDRW